MATRIALNLVKPTGAIQEKTALVPGEEYEFYNDGSVGLLCFTDAATLTFETPGNVLGAEIVDPAFLTVGPYTSFGPFPPRTYSAPTSLLCRFTCDIAAEVMLYRTALT